MTRTRIPANWAPLIFDDHGQPLCHTPEEEDALWAELAAAGLTGPPDPRTSHHPDDDPPY